MKSLIFIILSSLAHISTSCQWHLGFGSRSAGRENSRNVVKSSKGYASGDSDLPTIAGAAIATKSLSTLVTAVKAAGLVDTLSGEGTFTVFAPNNAAFGNIPSTALTNLLKPENIDQLKAVLLRHVLPSVIKADDIPQGITSLKTAGGEDISVTKSDGKVTIQSSSGQANVIATDIIASNGVVHIVDTVF